MSSNKAGGSSPLVAAAVAFDAALSRFSELTEALGKNRLDSRHALERAAESLQEIVRREAELPRLAQALGAALGAARDLQQAEAAAVQARALAIQKRSDDYADFLRRFEAIGADAAKLGGAAHELAARRASADRPLREKDLPTLLAELDDLQERTAALSGMAGGLAAAARDAAFADLHRQIDSLRQQMLATRDRIGLLKETIVEAAPKTLLS